MTTITSATFEMLAEPPIPEWVMRVTARGEGFEVRALPLAAQVGELAVEGIQLDIEGTGFVGFLVTEPPEGAMLRVGTLDEGLHDTGITYQRRVA